MQNIKNIPCEIQEGNSQKQVSKAISAETYELATVQAMIVEMIARIEDIHRSKTIGGGTKHWLKTTFLNRLNAMNNDMVCMLPSNQAKIMKDDIMSTDTALQLNEFKNLFLSLSKEQRDMTEDFMNAFKPAY